MAGAQKGVLIIYKVTFSFKVFAIFAEKSSIMWTAKGGKILRRGAEKASRKVLREKCR